MKVQVDDRYWMRGRLDADRLSAGKIMAKDSCGKVLCYWGLGISCVSPTKVIQSG